MAAFPPSLPGSGTGGGFVAPQPMGPPPSVPGVTASPAVPPQALIKALAKKPEQAVQLLRQAILSLEQAAELDPRLEDRIGAAVKLLHGPSKPDSNS